MCQMSYLGYDDGMEDRSIASVIDPRHELRVSASDSAGNGLSPLLS